jgi:hypothetical protein
MIKQRARVLWAYRGSGDLQGPWKRGNDTLTHTRLIQGNANHLKESLAAKLDIVSPGPGYFHFPHNPEAGFDEEFFRQLLSETTRETDSRTRRPIPNPRDRNRSD